MAPDTWHLVSRQHLADHGLDSSRSGAWEVWSATVSETCGLGWVGLQLSRDEGTFRGERVYVNKLNVVLVQVKHAQNMRKT